MALLTLEKTEILSGVDHSNTLHCCEFLARLFVLHNNNEKAEAMARRALNGLMTIVGPKDLDILQRSATLAKFLKKQGKLGEAKDFAWLALDGISEVMGQEHPKALLACTTLIEIVEKYGTLEEAKKVNRDFGVSGGRR